VSELTQDQLASVMTYLENLRQRNPGLAALREHAPWEVQYQHMKADEFYAQDDGGEDHPRTGIRDVIGFCPMGCGRTLHLMPSGHLVCLARNPDCPRSGAVSELLADPETEHVVRLEESAWSAKHPLRERLRDQLLTCDIHEAVACLRDEMPRGRYRVSFFDGTWAWEPLES
jgi:hypothetical protein